MLISLPVQSFISFLFLRPSSNKAIFGGYFKQGFALWDLVRVCSVGLVDSGKLKKSSSPSPTIRPCKQKRKVQVPSG